MKYYIKMINKQFNTTKFKRYKCCDGWSANKEECWEFSKAGALKIIDTLKKEYRRNIENIEFSIEEV